MYLTKQGFEKFKQELDYLIAKLPAYIKETGVMAALGDRSENAGYHASKALMRKTQSRIRYLENLLKKSTLISKNEDGKIGIGSTVELLNLENKQKESYTIVDSLEIDLEKGFISFHSPVGKCLLNKKIGEKIILELPNKKLEYLITGINN
ncbi:transcription elongation factor GreA [Patescibacteria group bacterium]|nr:transcription elongation factor GreA [Patescibacteria group bacterium]